MIGDHAATVVRSLHQSEGVRVTGDPDILVDIYS
jgi:hypothetical protein